MTLTPTTILNAVWYMVGLLAALGAEMPQEAFGYLPPKWKPVILVGIAVAGWMKAHANLFINPNGAPAALPFVAEGVEGAAEAAYEAYRAQAGGKSLATGAPIPAWAALMPAIQQAWKAAAGAAQAVPK